MLKSLCAVPLVLAAAALSLRGLDELALRALGHTRGVTRHARLDQAEARLGERLLLPAYFPDDLEWPPAEIVSAGDPPAVCVSFRGRADPTTRVRLCQATRERRGIPELLLARLAVLSEQLVRIHDEPARLLRLRGPQGEAWLELAFEDRGRAVVLRLRGAPERALRMAESLRRGRP